MNSNIKRVYLTVLSVIFAFCILLSCAVSFQGNAKADATGFVPTTNFESFEMADGVQLKIAGFKDDGVENAIRFVTTIDKDELPAGDGVKVVTLITPTELLEEKGINNENFTVENLNANDVKYSSVVFSETNNNLKNLNATQDKYVYNACLYNIKDANYTKEFSARSYITDANGKITQYTDYTYNPSVPDNAGSLWGVADAHKEIATDDIAAYGPKEDMTEKAYVESLCKSYDVSLIGFDNNSYSLTVKHGEALNDYIDVIKAELNVEGAAYINENSDVLSEIITTDKEDVALEMYALEFTADGDTYSVSKGTYEGAGQGVVKVPATYNGKTVKSVATAGFGINSGSETNQWLKKIVLPDSLTNIGDRAFRRCFGLEYIQCRGVEALNKNAQFYACNNLKTLVVGARTFIDDEWDTETKANYGQASIYRDTTVNTESGANLSITAGSTLFCDAGNNIVAKIYVYSSTFDWGGFTYDANGDVVAYNPDSYATYKSANSFNAPEDAQAVTYALNSAGTGYIAKPSTWMSQVLTRDGGVVNIPSSYNNKLVTETATNLFNTNTAIKKLILPSTLTTIGGQLIRKCTSLTYLDIRGITTSFDNSNKAYGCTALTSIVIGPNCGRLGKDFEVDTAAQAGKASVFFDGTLEQFNVTIGTTLKPNIAVSNRVYLLSQKENKPGCFYFDDNGFAVAWDENSYYTYNNGVLTAPDSAQ